MINLKDYGFTPFFATQLSSAGDLVEARICEIHKELYTVISKYGEGTAKLKWSRWYAAESADDFPAVGDFVLMQYNPLGNSTVVKILKRKSKFSRPDYSGHAVGYVKTVLEQVVATNFDYVFIMVAVNHDFSINRIQRYLAAARQSGGTPVIILTKADLCKDYRERVASVQKIAQDIAVIAISTYTGQGLELLNQYLCPGKTLVFLGSSGVGKSSLVNALAGSEIMLVNDIREDDSKGRHTTTHRQLIKLEKGAMIIDTPGMREIGMWGIGDSLEEAFPDIEALIAKCKFNNCSHGNEPGCAVRQALKSGELDPVRYETYLQLKKEVCFSNKKAKHKQKKAGRSKQAAKSTRSRNNYKRIMHD